MEGLTLANKLTLRHINYSENKMKCKLAAQMLSNSVADALIYLQKSKYPGFEDCLGTAEFCKMFDTAFDICNVRSKYSKNDTTDHLVAKLRNIYWKKLKTSNSTLQN